MNATILQENFHHIVSGAARSVAGKPQLPILSNILLKAEKGRMTAIGTDLTTTVAVSTGGKIDEEGSITVPARDLAAIASGLSAERVKLSDEKGKLVIRAGKTMARLIGIPADDFPEIDVSGTALFECPVVDFSSVLQKTLPAVSSDVGRPILTGVKFAPLKEELSVVATDGYRLSMVSLAIPIKKAMTAPLVIPARTLSEVLRLGSGDQVGVFRTEGGEVRFEFEDGWVSGRLLAGDFPSVDQIIPAEFRLDVTMDRKELERAIRLAAIFARETANIVRWNISDGTMRICANSPQIGENETTVDVVGKGSGEIAFNSRYVMDLLSAVGDVERIRFSMADSLKPGMFRLVENDTFRYIIMPVRVQKD